MSKSKEIATTHEIVKEILEKHPFTRNSDSKLYVKVCERIAPEAINQPFWVVFTNRDDWNIPGFETVRRTRQKIQHDNPHLVGDANVEAQRMLNENCFKEYARRV